MLEHRHVRVGVAEHGTSPVQQLQHVERRRFPHVAHIFLVSDAEEVHLRAVDRLLHGIEHLAHALDDEGRHRSVDVTSELDEPALEPVLARLPREVERIDWNAVAAKARTR